MKMSNSMFRNTNLGRAFLAAALLTGANAAIACDLSLWNGGQSGSPIARQPDDSEAVARYAGLCAMQVPGGATSYVQDDSPGGIDRIRARFYVLAGNTGDAVVYRGLNASNAPIFAVRVESDGDVRLLSNGSTAACTGCANLGGWNSIEIDWDAGGGQLSLWVNSDATESAADATASFSSPQTVSSVRLGNLNGASGPMNFDAYESRRSTAIGRLVHPDPNGDGNPTGINSQDFAALVADFSGTSLAPGTPDCNEDGEPALNSQDFACIVNAFLNQ